MTQLLFNSFTVQPIPGLNPLANQILAGDFNGDGKQDLFITRINFQGATAAPVVVLLGDGQGGFVDGTKQVFGPTVPEIHHSAAHSLVGDFNGDGLLDVFVPDFGMDAAPFPGGQNRLFLSNGHGLTDATAALPQRLSLGHAAAAADLDNNGTLDLLVSNLNDLTGKAEEAYFNSGSAQFTVVSNAWPVPVQTPGVFSNGYTWTYAGDLNNDGHTDVVFGTWDGNPNPSSVLLGTGSGGFSNAIATSLPRSGVDKESILQITPIDLNGDALQDLAVAVTNGGDPSTFYQVGYIQLLVNQGNGTFRDETQLRLPQDPGLKTGVWWAQLEAYDFTGDGATDLLAIAQTGHSVLYVNDGHGDFSIERVFDDGMTEAVDVDGDGRMDIVSVAQDGLHVYMNTAGNPATTPLDIHGTADGDRLTGRAGNDRLTAGGGDDVIDGGAGIDTALYTGGRARYDVTVQGTSMVVNDKLHLEGTDTLQNIERLQFADGVLAFDIAGDAGQAYRLYQAAFNRKPDLAGLGYQVSALDHGLTLQQVASNFIASAEFANTYGSLGAADFVTQLYANVLHRAPDAGGLAYYLHNLDTGATRGDVLVSFSESPENQAALVGAVSQGIFYTV